MTDAHSLEIIAHRGASLEAPENTLSSIKQAIALGADYVEIDVFLSKDGIPVVFHDETTTRTTNLKRKKIEKLSLGEIKALDAGSWFSSDFAFEKVPTLDDVLRLDFGKTGLMIEIKKETCPSNVIAFAVIDSINRSSFTNPSKIVIASFFPEVIQEIKLQKPSLTVLGIAEKQTMLDLFLNIGVDCMCLSKRLASKNLIEELQRKGLKVWVFTIDDAVKAEKFMESGVEGIITNDPKGIKGRLR